MKFSKTYGLVKTWLTINLNINQPESDKLTNQFIEKWINNLTTGMVFLPGSSVLDDILHQHLSQLSSKKMSQLFKTFLNVDI